MQDVAIKVHWKLDLKTKTFIARLSPITLTEWMKPVYPMKIRIWACILIHCLKSPDGLAVIFKNGKLKALRSRDIQRILRDLNRRHGVPLPVDMQIRRYLDELESEGACERISPIGRLSELTADQRRTVGLDISFRIPV